MPPQTLAAPALPAVEQRSATLPARVTRRLEALPLRVRLVAILMVLLVLALVLTASATAVLMRRDLIGRVDQDLRRAKIPVAQQAVESLVREGRRGLPNTYAVVFLPADGGEPIGVYPSNDTLRPAVPPLPLTDRRVRTGEPFTVGSTNGTMTWRGVAGRVRGDSATFAVATPLRSVDRTVRRLVLVELLIGLAVTVACGVLGWYAVRRAFRPLAQIEDTAAAIAAGDLGRRIPTRAAEDEVTSLSRSLNSMLSQIEQSFAMREASEERMRQFVADASHELRTPLATVRGYAELYRQGAVRRPEDVASAMGRIEGEAGRMGGLVEDLLLLARLDDRRPMQIASVDLTVLAADAAQDARAIDPTRRVSLLGLAGQLQPTVVPGDEAKLRQVLSNLVGNALRHTPAGTPVELVVGVRPGTDRAVLEVRDHGPGIDPASARRVFERFYRADPSRTRGSGGGNGLGLAIVAAIVGAHDGKVGVAQTSGGGATFVVELPTGNSQQASRAL
jgi:two-component system, OmpR family, sensor kinase